MMKSWQRAARAADVVADGVVKEVHVLEDDRDLPHEFLLRQGADVAAADEDAPLLRVGVAHDEADKAEAPVPNEGDERGGQRGEDGSNQHVADDEGVVVGFVDGTGEQRI